MGDRILWKRSFPKEYLRVRLAALLLPLPAVLVEIALWGGSGFERLLAWDTLDSQLLYTELYFTYLGGVVSVFFGSMALLDREGRPIGLDVTARGLDIRMPLRFSSYAVPWEDILGVSAPNSGRDRWISFHLRDRRVTTIHVKLAPEQLDAITNNPNAPTRFKSMASTRPTENR